MEIHPISYISLLEPANPETPIFIKLPRLSSENKYKIKKIINYNYKNQQQLIKQKKYNKKNYIGIKEKSYKL